MKYFFFLFLFFSLQLTLKAQQVKILFDATKAETAGNADWVIDANQFNIGFNHGPAVLNTGNESNPQRFPTPDQSLITQQTPEDYWTGALSYWGIDLVKNGFFVETLPFDSRITYGDTTNIQDLKNYKVYIVCEPNSPFNNSEKQAMLDFVNNGGGLFMVGDHDQSDRNSDGWDSPNIWNDFMNTVTPTNPFGILHNLESFSETTNNIPNNTHGMILNGQMGDVTDVMWSAGTSLTTDTAANPTVTAYIYRRNTTPSTNNILAASALYGQGKVFVLGDSSPADDGTGDQGDMLYDGWIADANGNHRKLIINATMWLASNETGVFENKKSNSELLLYPNPVNDFVTICIPTILASSSIQLDIIDCMGQNVKNIFLKNCETISIDCSQFAKGIYFYALIANNARQYKGNFIVN